MPFRPGPAVAGGAALLLALTLTGCGSDKKSGTGSPETEVSATPAAQVTTAPAADAEVIAIRLTASAVDPSGDRIQVKPGQPIVLQINAEKAGELHVHSSPEQHIAFPAGGSEITLKFSQPGIIEIEDHALDKTIVELEVR